MNNTASPSSTANNVVRIGILSFAHGHANSYASALTMIPGVQLVGIYDDDSERGRNAAERFNTTYYPDAETLLGRKPDGVIICSENAHHAPLVQLAAGWTQNILCEKPLATTRADAQAMIDRCHATGTRLQTAFPVRFLPPIQQLKDMLDRQELGEIYAVKCTNHGAMPAGWFQDPKLAGGGAVIDHTVHVIDVLRWFWQCEVEEVYAEIGVKLLHPDADIDDAGILSFRLSNGVYGTLDTSWSRRPSNLAPVDVKIEVLGEHGAVTTDALGPYLTVNSDQWGQSRWISWGSNMDFGLISDFVEMIRTGRNPSITGTDGLRALEVALAAYQSATLRRPVAISEVS